MSQKYNFFLTHIDRKILNTFLIIFASADLFKQMHYCSSDIDLDKLKDGDEREFRLFFNMFYPRMMSVACRFVAEADAEDIVQGVFLKYWENRTALSPDTIHSYLYKCTQNSCLNHIKHQAVVSGHLRSVNLAEERIAFQNANSGRSDSWENVVARDVRKLLDEKISALSPKCREAFLLSFYSGLTYREISEVMDISPRTVEEYVQKSTKHLRAELKDILLSVMFISGLGI